MDDENDEKTNVATATTENANQLRDICLCRGVCNCSGDCGNTLIKGAIHFYMALMNGDLDVKMFDGTTRTTQDEKERNMWRELLKVFKNEATEWLIDMLCLIHLMTLSLPNLESQDIDVFGTESWNDDPIFQQMRNI